MAYRLSSLGNLSRRGLLIGGGFSLAAWKAMPSTPGCVLTAEQETGPYYIEQEKLRQDVTEGKPGVPVKLRVALVDARSCAPLENAALDIWHCDALGVYSGFTANSPDGPAGGGPMPPPPGSGPGPREGGPPPARQTDAARFLRGVQITDKKGLAEFATVYPGWYYGRPIHIHMKVNLGGSATAGIYGGGHTCHTGQLFFPEDITEQVAKLEPYQRRLSVHRTLQTEDNIFKTQHGSASVVNLTRLVSGSNTDGFLATITLAVDPEATPVPVGGRRRPTGA
jgi:protocatechuate 3,4-dioxygenase beta subunit